MKDASITRRLIASVLLLEVVAALALIGAITLNERKVQYKAFDANLRSQANTLFGAVQDADDAGDNVVLAHRGLALPDGSVYSVTDDRARSLGESGMVPPIAVPEGSFVHAVLDGRSYRFFAFGGERIIDPTVNGGRARHIHIVYGLPDGHVAHEVFEAVRFFTVATAILLGATTLLLIWLIRRLLAPLRELALEADRITATEWHFDPPAAAGRFVEVRPLVVALEKTIGRLQRSFEHQKRFTSDAAHELKTDIAIVKSSLQLLAMKRRAPEDYARGLALGLDDFSRLERTVQKMLTLSRVEQPTAEPGITCRFDQALQDAVQQCVSFAEIKGLEVRVSAVQPMIVGLDRHDADLLCMNLLLNALQHSLNEGTVEATCRMDGGQLCFTVRDHGSGIREEDMPHLFEPFYRGDPSRSRKSGGTGLGLSICKAICERCAGSIEVGNHPGGGAVVSVVLPVVTA